MPQAATVTSRSGNGDGKGTWLQKRHETEGCRGLATQLVAAPTRGEARAAVPPLRQSHRLPTSLRAPSTPRQGLCGLHPWICPRRPHAGRPHCQHLLPGPCTPHGQFPPLPGSEVPTKSVLTPCLSLSLPQGRTPCSANRCPRRTQRLLAHGARFPRPLLSTSHAGLQNGRATCRSRSPLPRDRHSAGPGRRPPVSACWLGGESLVAALCPSDVDVTEPWDVADAGTPEPASGCSQAVS